MRVYIVVKYSCPGCSLPCVFEPTIALKRDSYINVRMSGLLCSGRQKHCLRTPT